MLESLRHFHNDNGNRAFVEGKLRRGCWECYHQIAEHQMDIDTKFKCEVTMDSSGQQLLLNNIYCVPDECKYRIYGYNFKKPNAETA